MINKSLKFCNVTQQTTNVRWIHKPCLSCRSIYKKAMKNKIGPSPCTLNGLGCTTIGRFYARHKSTKHSFPTFSRPYATPGADPEQRRSLMGKNPSLTAASDPPARIVPGSGELGTAAREGLSHHAMLFTVIFLWSPALCFRSLSSPIL